MTKYKVLINGEEEDEIFFTEEEAEDYLLEMKSCTRAGAEILHMSNPGDYDYDDDWEDDNEYEIIEIED